MTFMYFAMCFMYLLFSRVHCCLFSVFSLPPMGRYLACR